MKLNGGRHVQGILRGFDPFMNLVIDECVEMATSGQQNNIGMVVSKGGKTGRWHPLSPFTSEHIELWDLMISPLQNLLSLDLETASC